MKQIVAKLLLIIILLNYSCSKDKKVNYYPENLKNIEFKSNVGDLFKPSEPVKKNLEEFFRELRKSKLYFRIENDSSINFVEIDFFKTGHFRRYNCLKISLDTIWFDKAYSIDKLDSILPLHYFNYGKYHFASKKPNRAFVMVKIDTSSQFKDLESIYSKILSCYKKQVENKNDSTELIIKWNWLNFFPPPPSPQKQSMISR